MNEVIKNITIKGVRLDIATSFREGKSLLFFLHGIGCVKESFIDAWQHKDLKDYALLAIDLPGFGNSSRPGAFSYSMEDHAEVCKLVLEKYSGNVHIIAHSMGGAIGLLLAHRMGENLGSLISAEGVLGIEDVKRFSARIEAMSYKEFSSEFLPTQQLLAAQAKLPGNNLWAEWSKKADLKAMYHSAKAIVPLARSGMLLESFFALKNKSYFYGALKPPPILARLEGIQTIGIPNAGHFIMNDTPKEFYKRLGEVLTV